jgi:hypothetical protein
MCTPCVLAIFLGGPISRYLEEKQLAKNRRAVLKASSLDKD